MLSMSSDFRQFARSPQCRLRGGLREVAGRSRLVVDGHDFRLATAKQPDSRGGRLSAVSGEHSGLTFKDRFRGVGAGFRQFDRCNRVAGRKTRMEIHLRAAGMRPLVQAGRCVGGNGNRTCRRIFAETEGIASRQCGAERRDKACWAIEARQIGGKKRAADLRTGLIADDRRRKQCRAGERRSFRQCEQGRPEHHAVVADAGGVHVFTHQAVAQRRVGEGRIARR